MGDILKWLNKAAVKLGSTWGTEVTVGANDGIAPLNPGAPQLKLQMVEDESYGPYQSSLIAAAFQAVDFTLDFNYRYDGLENLLLAILLGADSVSEVQTGEAWKHTMALQSKETKFVSYVTERLGKIYSVPSANALKASFSVNNGLIRLNLGLRGNKVIDNSTVNTSLSSVTLNPSATTLAKFQTGSFKIDSVSVTPKNFTVDIERSLTSDIVAGGSEIIEPIDNEKPKVTVTLEFAKIDTSNQAFFQDWIQGTNHALEITFTGTQIPTTSPAVYFTLKMSFPVCVVESAEYPDDKVIPAKISFRSLGDQTNNPVTIELTNTRQTSYLA